MRQMLEASGFIDILIKVKENASDIIKDWMPGSGAEKYVTSAYITATKPRDGQGIRDNPRESFTAAPVACGLEDAGPGC